MDNIAAFEPFTGIIEVKVQDRSKNVKTGSNPKNNWSLCIYILVYVNLKTHTKFWINAKFLTYTKLWTRANTCKKCIDTRQNFINSRNLRNYLIQAPTYSRNPRNSRSLIDSFSHILKIPNHHGHTENERNAEFSRYLVLPSQWHTKTN